MSDFYEPVEYKVYYSICMNPDCDWSDDHNHIDHDECETVCPKCGWETEIEQDWDNR